MTVSRLFPSTATLHGHFSPDLPPVLTIDSGNRVVARTLDARWSVFEAGEPFELPSKFEPRDRARDPGHALVGPIAVRGARKGMTLAVRIHRIRTGRWGWSSAGGFPSPLNQRLGLAEPPEHFIGWALDPDRGVARDRNGHELPMRPFMGLMGMPPDEPGRHSTIPPRPCGGNIDCRELIEGSVLYLPIPVDGALFSLGDGHALQGDGEMAGPALECPMEEVEVELTVLETPRLTMPRADTPAGWITFGFHEDLNEAMPAALDGMLSLMGELHGLKRKEALSLASLLVSLRITQVVNGVRGVHAILPHGVLGATSSRSS